MSSMISEKDGNVIIRPCTCGKVVVKGSLCVECETKTKDLEVCGKSKFRGKTEFKDDAKFKDKVEFRDSATFDKSIKIPGITNTKTSQLPIGPNGIKVTGDSDIYGNLTLHSHFIGYKVFYNDSVNHAKTYVDAHGHLMFDTLKTGAANPIGNFNGSGIGNKAIASVHGHYNKTLGSFPIYAGSVELRDHVQVTVASSVGYVVGETVTHSTSGATGVIHFINGAILNLYKVVGNITVAGTITGVTSATVSNVAGVVDDRLGMSINAQLDLSGTGVGPFHVIHITKTLNAAVDSYGQSGAAASVTGFNINAYSDTGTIASMQNEFYIVDNITGYAGATPWTQNPMNLTMVTLGGTMPVTDEVFPGAYPNAKIVSYISSNPDLSRGVRASPIHFQTGDSTNVGVSKTALTACTFDGKTLLPDAVPMV